MPQNTLRPWVHIELDILLAPDKILNASRFAENRGRFKLGGTTVPPRPTCGGVAHLPIKANINRPFRNRFSAHSKLNFVGRSEEHQVQYKNISSFSAVCCVPMPTLTKRRVSGIISPMQFSITAIPKAIYNTTLELIFPRFCPICGTGIESSDKYPLCETCRKDIRQNGRIFPESPKDGECHFDISYSVALYEGTIRECIHKFKYNGSLGMEALFADLMTSFAEKYMTINDFDRIISVPLHRAKLRERTFNQAEMLALPLSRKFRIPYVGNNLVRIKPGRSQTSLSKSGRVKDIEGAFRVRNAAALKDKSVLLVDDVFTTGATVNECSMVLKEAGAKYVGVFTLARGV